MHDHALTQPHTDPQVDTVWQALFFPLGPPGLAPSPTMPSVDGRIDLTQQWERDECVSEDIPQSQQQGGPVWFPTLCTVYSPLFTVFILDFVFGLGYVCFTSRQCSVNMSLIYALVCCC